MTLVAFRSAPWRRCRPAILSTAGSIIACRPSWRSRARRVREPRRARTAATWTGCRSARGDGDGELDRLLAIRGRQVRDAQPDVVQHRAAESGRRERHVEAVRDFLSGIQPLAGVVVEAERRVRTVTRQRDRSAGIAEILEVATDQAHGLVVRAVLQRQRTA